MSDSETRRPRHALVDDEVVAPETGSTDADVSGGDDLPHAEAQKADVPQIDVPAPSTPRDDVVESRAAESAATAADTTEGAEQVDPPTTALPIQRSARPEPPTTGEFTDDATMVLPVIPAQRMASPAGHPMSGRVRPALPDYSYPAPPPVAPRRRVLPAVLAGVTAVLLVAGIAVGVGGAPAELATPPAPTANP